MKRFPSRDHVLLATSLAFLINCYTNSHVLAQSPQTTVPAMKWADDSRTGRPFSKDPSVVRFGDRYFMYFSLRPFDEEHAKPQSPRGWSIGIAESEDLNYWTKVAELWPAQECDQNGLCAPGAIVLHGKMHLFYQTYGNGAKDAICHAVSDDGLTFVRDSTNPVFHPEGDWTSGRAIDAEVFPVGGRLMLYFATRDPNMKRQMIGVAAADLDSDFSRGRWTQLVDGPILKPTLPWEGLCIEAPTVVRRGKRLFMFYAGNYNNEPQQIGVATSQDGVVWKRMFDEPVLRNGNEGEWNSSESGHPGVFVDEKENTHLFFQGNNDGGNTWWLARASIKWKDDVPSVASLPIRRLLDYPTRDTSICLAADGSYYMTATTGHPTWWKTNDGIRVWRSEDMRQWQPLGMVWSIEEDGTWQKEVKDGNRAIWAPEIHYLRNTFWITYSVNWPGGATGLLKSTSGRADGPYVDAKKNGPMTDEIDASLFQDDDGTVYYVYQDGKIARMNDDLSGLAEKPRLLRPANSQHVGFEGAMIVKMDDQYHLVCAEFNPAKIGRTYDCMIASSDKLYGPYGDRYLAIPHGGHNSLFQDKHGKWWATFFGNDPYAPWIERAGILPVRRNDSGRIVPESR